MNVITTIHRLSQAHARLMFREKVTIQDAIVAVSLVESSMQGSALIGGIDALHTSFPYNPMEEYRVQGEPDHHRDCYYHNTDACKLWDGHLK